MHKFKDSTGRQWDIDEDGFGFAMERVEASCKFCLMDLQDVRSESAQAVLNNPVKLTAILIAMCEPEKKGVHVNAFKMAVYDGDTQRAATWCLLEAVADFLPRREQPVMKALIDVLKKAVEKAAEKGSERVADLQQAMNLSEATGDSAGSSASTREDSTSDS